MIASIPGLALVLICGEAWAQTTSGPGAADLVTYHQETRESVAEVLAMREFVDLKRGVEDWWFRLLKWLEKCLLAIASTFRGLPSWLFWVLIVWMVATLVAILGHFLYVLWGIIGVAAARRASAAAANEGRGELLGIRELDFDSVNRLAREHLAAGDWPAATKYLYVAAILWLDRQGWITFGISKTNYDYIAELARQPEYRSAFRQLTNRFESTVYGGEPYTAKNCQEMTTLVDHLLREVNPVVAI
jgi:hypothetical protein